MRIVIDGDSVAEDREDNWPTLLNAESKFEVFNFSKHQSTTKDVMTRLGKIIAHRPEWLILQLGQWSSKNENPKSFKKGLRYIVRTVQGKRIKVCLVTPPRGIIETDWTAIIIRFVRREFNCAMVDVHHLMENDGSGQHWFLPEANPSHLNMYGSKIVARYFFDKAEQPYGGFP